MDGACRPGSGPPCASQGAQFRGKSRSSGRGRQGASTASFANRTCRPIWGPGLKSMAIIKKRDAAGPGILNCCASFPLGDFRVPPQSALNIESRTGTVGFVAGADLTFPGAFFLQTMVSSQG